MVTRYIAAAVSIPVIADADTGFGNAINVMRSVEDFIVAGARRRSIEDQVAPKRCGHVAGGSHADGGDDQESCARPTACGASSIRISC